jgi:glucose/arabinose dehydrogenase
MLGARSTLAVGVVLALTSAVYSQTIYVSDYSYGMIEQFKPSGAESVVAYGLNGPEGLAFDTQTSRFFHNPFHSKSLRR